MWTPKRVLLLALGLAVFFAGYVVYSFFLGGIDGMPPLPPEFLRAETPSRIEPPSNTETGLDKKVRLAFGKDCPQLKQRYKFEIRKKEMIVTATDIIFNEPDGRVKLVDFNVAIFKDYDENRVDANNCPEINTITSDVAYLSFVDEHGKDLKIEGPNDMSKGKISAGELRGHIKIINNRHTEETHDDLVVMVDMEPLFFKEDVGKVWTHGFVQLLDHQTKPHPTKITGHGMELYLAKDKAQDKKQPGARAPKGKNDLGGVDRIELKSSVEMDLYTDAKSDFMSGSAKAPAANAKTEVTTKTNKEGGKQAAAEGQAAADKSHIKIKTDGPFVFEVSKDVARFDSPPAKEESHYPDRVQVLRRQLRDEEEDQWDIKCDQLDCDVLTLKFLHREVPANAPKGESSANRQIESAQATARPGTDVVLSLDSNNLDCRCQQLDYWCPTAERGARTVLRGDPLHAAKDGHKITTRELVLVQANPEKGTGQQMIAQGPGQVDLYDNSPDPAKGPHASKGYTTHAKWKGLLTQTKYKEADRDLTLLTLTEDAMFIDDDHGQKLAGQTLKVWLDESEVPSQATLPDRNTTAAPGGPRQKPAKIEAYDRVTAQSPESRINCDRLTIRFKDAAPVLGVLPGAVPPPAPGAVLQGPPGLPALPNSAKPGVSLPQSSPAGNALSLGFSPPAREGKDKEKDKDKDKPKKPIDLRAREVSVEVLRSPDKNELHELVAIGNVSVHQDGEKPEDKGVDIKGETLNLLHFVEGDIIKVLSAGRDAQAALQLESLYLIGPKVTINQKENKAAVEGGGAMSMPSNTSFNGDKPSKAGTRLTVHFDTDMVFDGRDAEFRGGVVAYQDDSTLQCQLLEVELDHRVSLKEGQKGDQKAKVEKVVAYGKVCVTDEAKDAQGRPQTQRLNCHEMNVDNPENLLNTTGPGSATALQYETPGDLDGGKTPKQTKEPARSPELTLTRVDFLEHMYSKQLNDTTRTTTFRGNIFVVHMPATSLDAQPNPDKLPKDALLMKCSVLTVLERKLPDGKKSQQMVAKDRVYCQMNDMRANAEEVTFDKNQDTMVLKGSPANPAVVWRQVGGPGSQWQTTQALVIIYNRKLNTVQVDAADHISGQLAPTELLRPDEEWVVASR